MNIWTTKSVYRKYISHQRCLFKLEIQFLIIIFKSLIVLRTETTANFSLGFFRIDKRKTDNVVARHILKQSFPKFNPPRGCCQDT